MKKQVRRCELIYLLFAIIIYTSSDSQTKRLRRNDLDVRIKISVSGSPDTSIQYLYIFSNSAKSHQSMAKAIIDLQDDYKDNGGTIKNIRAPKEKDWGDFPDVGNKMRWIEQYDTTGKDILERPPRSSVAPGEQISFSFECLGLPSFGHFWAAGWAPWYFTQDVEDSLLRGGYPEYDLHPTDSLYFTGLTVVPRLPFANFDASLWLDTLLSYTHQSVDLGWLGKNRDDDCENDENPQDGIEKNIERRLMMAQRDLQHSDSVKARRDIQMLVDKIDRIWKRGQIEEKKHEHDRGDWWQHRKDWVIMTSEAYALLKYNTEYLIDRLPERERRGGREEKK